jgi:hypothetical protein
MLEMRKGGPRKWQWRRLGRGLHEMTQQWDEQSLDGGGVFGSKRCTHHPGMHHVGSNDCLIQHRCGLQPPGQLAGEHDVGELGLAVGLGAGVAPFTLEVSEVDAPRGLRMGRNRDSGRELCVSR